VDVPFLLGEAQMHRIEPFFPLSHGIPRVDDRRIISGIVYVIKHGLMWRDAPEGYGPHSMKKDLAIRALDMAVRLRQPPEGCLFHSDGGRWGGCRLP
jgi:transposase